MINRHISDPAQQLRVFDPNGVYLATKKIGKNNPKAAEIEADYAARQEWNRTADMALLSGIAEETIIELKNEEIHNKAADSVTKHGWLPELFRKIVRTAKELLQGIIAQDPGKTQIIRWEQTKRCGHHPRQSQRKMRPLSRLKSREKFTKKEDFL